MGTERYSHTNKSFLPCNQVVAPMLYKRLNGGIWEKSIEYPRKVYRVFSNSTIQTIRYLPSSTPIPPILRSVSFVQTIRNLPSPSRTSSIFRAAFFVQTLCHLPTPTPTAPILYSVFSYKRLVTFHPLPHFLANRGLASTLSALCNHSLFTP